jgi:hypothetical protein
MPAMPRKLQPKETVYTRRIVGDKTDKPYVRCLLIGTIMRQALLKTSVNNIEPMDRYFPRDKNLLVISLTKYVQWKLKRSGIISGLFSSINPVKSIDQLHNELKNKYDYLCGSMGTSHGFDLSDLFMNHIIWEIQESYYFILSLNLWITKHKIQKIYFEPVPLQEKARYTKTLNELTEEYCVNNGVCFEKI